MSHARVVQMVTDSLRYWACEMHVDGFRFDLGTILAREDDGFNEAHGFLQSLHSGPGPRHHQAHCRTLGHRSRRLSGRRFPAWLGRMER